METLPEDVITGNIFSLLSIESTLQCRRVCRTWKTIIGGSNAVESNDIVGSCNGLVCYKAVDPTYPKDGLAFICSNPITGEAISIPGLKKNRLITKRPVGGFGYVGLTNEYKVVRICNSANVEVYTLGSPLGWRDKGLIIPFNDRFLEFKESGIFANGALNWINGRWFDQNPNPKMLAFGLADEEFSPVPVPPCLRTNKDCRSDSKLILLGDIWVFKKTNNGTSCGETKEKREYYYDHTWSWSLEYSIAWEGGKDLYTPFVITKRNTVLLLQNGTSNLFCYDPKTSTLQKYSDGDERILDVQAIPHMNSLV
ncbi:F-box protein At3g07870-like [Papaver somniferum]|uniref:F-box protein At3g07870-like n=1 Tax=Papaver somniferum TaxID=3469 RepID=UPI000E6FC74E|nr:F-box protein At3g07870-like [Papaver somniferum]